jgi:hypothetical protein
VNKITTLGIDLAKNVFQLHGVDESGAPVLRLQVRRRQLLRTLAQLPPCLIGMEACGSAQHWGRQLERHGHTVRLMSPQFVKPYVEDITQSLRGLLEPPKIRHRPAITDPTRLGKLLDAIDGYGGAT